MRMSLLNHHCPVIYEKRRHPPVVEDPADDQEETR